MLTLANPWSGGSGRLLTYCCCTVLCTKEGWVLVCSLKKREGVQSRARTGSPQSEPEANKHQKKPHQQASKQPTKKILIKQARASFLLHGCWLVPLLLHFLHLSTFFSPLHPYHRGLTRTTISSFTVTQLLLLACSLSVARSTSHHWSLTRQGLPLLSSPFPPPSSFPLHPSTRRRWSITISKVSSPPLFVCVCVCVHVCMCMCLHLRIVRKKTIHHHPGPTASSKPLLRFRRPVQFPRRSRRTSMSSTFQ